jgi:uncharacterized membrane protein YbaN (DUF454 family)
MTIQEAKQILLIYRPGTADEQDAEVKEALALARNDPSFQTWLQEQCAFHELVRGKLQQIRVPHGLHQSILAHRKIVRPAAWWQSPITLAAAAAVVLLLGVAAFWGKASSSERFANFQARMVGTALREYRMDIETNDMATVRHFLASKGAPADYEVTRGLAALQVVGGGCLRWRSNPVSMVCFKKGGSMLYLFVMNRSAVNDPPSSTPQEGNLRGMTTVSWTVGENTYVLAGPEEADFARKYL